MPHTKTPPPFRTRLAALFADIGRSCYDVERYRVFRARPVRDAVRYFAAFLAVLAAVTCVAFLAFALPVPGRVAAHLRATLPEDAVFAFADGRLAAEGLELPARLGTGALPVILDTSIEGTDAAPGVGVIDGLVLGRDAALLVEEGRVVTAQPFGGIPNARFTKAELVAWIDRDGIALAALAALLFTLAHAAIVGLSAATFALTASVLALGVGRLWGSALTYRQWLAVGLHAVTLPILADHVLWGLSARLPFAYPVLFFMVIVAVLADEREAALSAPAEEPEEGGEERG